MRSALLLVLLATSAGAQVASPDRARVPTAGDGVLLVLVTAGAGLASGYVIGPYAPAPMAAALFGTSAAIGLRPTVPGFALDATVGFGAGAITTVMYREMVGTDGWRDLEAALVGSGVGILAATTVHVLRLRWLRSDRVGITPVPLAALTGAGIRLTVVL
ncbi:MAG: hypothetical protein AAGK21_12400 [Bacteroidota bacterium]